MNTNEQLKTLLRHPQKLLQKKPFTRGASSLSLPSRKVDIGERIESPLPRYKKQTIHQSDYLRELDPNCHKVLFDDNIPAITMKLNDGRYVTIEYKKMAIPFQRIIRDKQVLHLCGNPMLHNISTLNPTEKQKEDFVVIKQAWNRRNMDGMKTKMVSTQKSMGDAGLLFYLDRNDECKCRLVSFEDGYSIISHNDQNGDRLMECLYYESEDYEYLDCYDDEYMTRFRRGGENVNLELNDGWVMVESAPHGFGEIPLITKRGDVAWEQVLSEIEMFEVMYNIFMVIQKRHGWGILYVKGKFSDKGQKIAGAVVLNDTSLEGNGSAEFKSPPSPQGYLDTLKNLYKMIQLGSGTTFLLPEDVHVNGDVSGVAIMLTQSLDIQTAEAGVIEWQNVASKMMRLFKRGFAIERVRKGIQPTAITDFDNLEIDSKFQVWRPKSESETVSNLTQLKAANLISQQTGIETSPYSQPDEVARYNKERDENEQRELEQQQQKNLLKVDNNLKTEDNK